MKYFVVGMHRAGSHSFAKYIAEQKSVAYIEEGAIRWDNLALALALPDNACIQCPGLSHEAIELSKHGKVYWVTRNKEHILNSMKNAGMAQMSWHLMRGFKTKYPNDPIWQKLKYSDRTDCHSGFIGYHTLLVNVKEYFYTKYFKGVVEFIEAEKQSYYNKDETLSIKKPLKSKELLKISKHQTIWDEAYGSL